MLTLPYDSTPLELMSLDKLNVCLDSEYPSHLKTTRLNNLLTIQFDNNKKILVAITNTMTWGQLKEALVEKGF